MTAFTAPCATIRACFADGDSSRISAKLHPHESRVYARVITPGRIRAGENAAIVSATLGHGSA